VKDKSSKTSSPSKSLAKESTIKSNTSKKEDESGGQKAEEEVKEEPKVVAKTAEEAENAGDKEATN